MGPFTSIFNFSSPLHAFRKPPFPIPKMRTTFLKENKLKKKFQHRKTYLTLCYKNVDAQVSMERKPNFTKALGLCEYLTGNKIFRNPISRFIKPEESEFEQKMHHLKGWQMVWSPCASVAVHALNTQMLWSSLLWTEMQFSDKFLPMDDLPPLSPIKQWRINVGKTRLKVMDRSWLRKNVLSQSIYDTCIVLHSLKRYFFLNSVVRKQKHH